MIFILTYHRVAQAPEPKPQFYTVNSRLLEHQVAMLDAAGFRALEPQDLLKFKPGRHPAYVLTFDDGTADHYEVVIPLLEQLGRRAVFFVPTAKLNRPGYLTSAQAREISKRGHTLGLHGHEHRRLDLFDDEDIRVQMEISGEILQELTGAAPEFFAPIGGYTNARVKQVAKERGVRVTRTMRWGYNRRIDLSALECVPFNRHLKEDEFRRILRFENMRFVYNVKQVVKRVVPMPLYERLRVRVFRALGRE